MSQRRPPRDQKPLHTAADLTALWRWLLHLEPLRCRSLWILVVDPSRRPRGPLLTIDDLPDGPYDVPRDDLVSWCTDLLEGPGGGGSVAVMMSRPGGGGWTVSDRAWGRFLIGAVPEIGGEVWPVHLAHRTLVEQVRLEGGAVVAG